MKLSEISSENVKLDTISGEDFQIESLTSFDFPKEKCALFLKNRKFFQQFCEVLQQQGAQSFSQMLVFFSEKLWKQLSTEQHEEMTKTFAALATVDDIDMLMVELSEYFYYQAREKYNDIVDGRQMGTARVHPSAQVAQGAFIGADVEIEADAIIHSGVRILSGCKIGKGTEIYPNAVIYQNCQIGQFCRIHGQVVIGSDGFGLHFHGGKHQKIWHFGGVIIGNEVEIGANSCVDAGTFSATIIGDGCKIDNQVQIAHNCVLGRGVVMCGQAGLGGSVRLGDFVVMGGKSGVGNGFRVAAGSEIAGAALVNCDWDEPTQLGGHPARPLREWLKGLAYVRKNSLK